MTRVSGPRAGLRQPHFRCRTRRRAEDARPLGWLAKPFDAATLVRAVRSALEEAG